MTWLDYVLLAFVFGSIALSLFRGLVAEVLSLGSWVVAFFAARSLSPELAEFMPVPGEGLKLVAAFLVLLIGTWLIAWLLKSSLTVVLDGVGLGGVNRFLGGIFGLVRGLLLATVVVMLGGLSDLPKTPAWQQSLFAQPFEVLALAARPWLPNALAGKLQFY